MTVLGIAEDGEAPELLKKMQGVTDMYMNYEGLVVLQLSCLIQ